jgi:hypothetical protein
MVELIDAVSTGVPKTLTEIIMLGRTLEKRAADVLAHFDLPGPDQGHQRPTRTPPRLRPRFRNLTSYIARSLLKAGGFRPQLHPHL